MEQPAPTSPPPETRALIYDWGRGALDRQLAAVDALDGKMAQALAAGSILLALPAASGISGDAPAVLLGCATAAFLVVAVLAVHAFWVRRWRAPLSPSQAWREYWEEEADVFRHAVVADTSKAYEENDGLIASKARSLRWALFALGGEAVLVSAAAIAARSRVGGLELATLRLGLATLDVRRLGRLLRRRRLRGLWRRRRVRGLRLVSHPRASVGESHLPRQPSQPRGDGRGGWRTRPGRSRGTGQPRQS